MKKESVVIPGLYLAGLLIVLILIARTSVFTPLVRFVHTPAGSLGSLILCVGVGIGALWAVYRLLDVLCGYYAPLFDEREKQERKTASG